MASKETNLDTKDLVLMLIDANEGVIEGRTVLQKISYFAGKKLGWKLAFAPHYYGPFSTEIEDSTDLLVSQGLLTEMIERLPVSNPTTGFGLRKYTYNLTQRGEKYLRQRLSQFPKTPKAAEELVKSIKRESGLNPSVLSAAAKIHYIVSAEGEPLSTEAIAEKAADIGWDLGKEEINQVGELLVSLRFLKRIKD